MPLLVVFVGPICSGKSTLAQELARQGFIVANDDAIVNIIHADDYTLYNKQLKPLYKAVEDEIIHTGLTLGRDVVIDRPNLSPKTRAHYLALAKRLDADVVAVMFPNAGPEEHAKRRFKQNSRGLPYEHWFKAAIRHQQNAADPTIEEGFNCVMTAEKCRSLFVNCRASILQELLHAIL